MHVGGYNHVLVPAAAALALWTGCAVGRLGPARSGAWALACLQFAWFAFAAHFTDRLPRVDWLEQVPSAQDVAAGERVIERLRALDAPVFAPGSSYLVRRAGHSAPSLHAMALNDLLQSEARAVVQPLVDDLVQSLKEQRFAAILLHDHWDDLPQLTQSYAPAPFDVYAGADVFLPVTGGQSRPQLLYLPK